MNALSETLYGQPRHFRWADRVDVQRVEQFLLENRRCNPNIPTVEHLLNVLAVPNQSIVEVVISQDALLMTAGRPDLGLQTSQNVVIAEDRQWKLHWHMFEVAGDAQRQRIATTIYAHAVKFAAQYEFIAFTVFAMRDTDKTGYCVFPKLGFDGYLSDTPEEFERLLKNLADEGIAHSDLEQLVTVQDVLTLERGQELWETHGFSVYLTFDLEPRSSAWEIFEAYLVDKDFEFAERWLL